MRRVARFGAALLALLATTACVALLEAGGAFAANPPAGAGPGAAATPGTEEEAEGGDGGVGGLAGAGKRPQLLLIHGGSFLYDDADFEPLTRDRALAAGFVPHYVVYPLGNLPAAVARVRAEARRLREKFGRERVYAYGSSAGGTLAALLSGGGQVDAAVAKAPVSNLTTWTWPLGKYGPQYWETLGVGPVARARLSPALRPQHKPLLVIQGRADGVVPPQMNAEFAARFRRVKLWVVAGGHTTDRARPFLVTRAMRWLARIAQREMGLERAETTHAKARP